jgi:hypothetical protein
MGGVAREHGMKALAIGGVEDHAHVLLAAVGLQSAAGTTKILRCAENDRMAALPGKDPAALHFPPELTALATGL